MFDLAALEQGLRFPAELLEHRVAVPLQLAQLHALTSFVRESLQS
jgi:hypothetical protein